MNPELGQVTLGLGQIILLGGVLIGFGRMRESVDSLTKSHVKFAEAMTKNGDALAAIAERVSVLEERTGGRRRGDRPS